MIYITEVSIEDGVLKKVICNNIQDDNSEEITVIGSGIRKGDCR